MSETKQTKRDAEALVCRAETLQTAGVWYAIRTATRQEEWVEEGLTAEGVEVYLPVRTVWRRLRTQKTKDHRPLFPGYVFVQCTPADFDRIRSVEGFHQFVRMLGADGEPEPIPFPAHAIGDLMMRQAFGDFDSTKAKPELYRPKAGHRVLVTGGKWYGFFAEVLSLSVRERTAKIRVEGKGGAPATVSFVCLEEAEALNAA